MKKLLLLAGIVAFTTSVFAQGTVNFNNTSTTLITTNRGGITGTAAAGQVTYELLVAPNGTSSGPINQGDVLGQWALVSRATGNVAGRIFGGTQTNTLTSAGGPMAVMVRAWLNGGSYDTAEGWGHSTILQLATSGNPNAAPPGTPAALFGPGLLQGFEVIVPVPEPSSIALGLLGLGAIALIRRRK